MIVAQSSQLCNDFFVVVAVPNKIFVCGWKFFYEGQLCRFEGIICHGEFITFLNNKNLMKIETLWNLKQ